MFKASGGPGGNFCVDGGPFMLKPCGRCGCVAVGNFALRADNVVITTIGDV